MQQGLYNNYFKNHYKARLNATDLLTSSKWLYPQWKLICQHVKLTSKSRILEIGSGFGGFYNYLKSFGYSDYYTGLEMDNEACKFSNTYFKTNKFINKSFEEYDSKDNFDFIFAFEVLEHLEDPQKSLSKIYSLLKLNSYFVGSSPFPYQKNIVADKTHKYVLHPVNWKKLFERSGFKEINTHPMSFVPFVWRIDKHLNIRLPFYVPFPNFISTTLLVAKK